MPVHCAIVGCTLKTQKPPLHSFPKHSISLCKRWIEASGNKRLRDRGIRAIRTLRGLTVCDRHFEANLRLPNKRLRKDAMPTLELPEPIKMEEVNIEYETTSDDKHVVELSFPEQQHNSISLNYSRRPPANPGDLFTRGVRSETDVLKIYRCVVCDIGAQDNPNATFYEFPKDLEKKKLWIRACGLKGVPKNTQVLVCSQHFRDTCFSDPVTKKVLLPHAVPKVRMNEKKDLARNSAPVVTSEMQSDTPQETEIENAPIPEEVIIIGDLENICRLCLLQGSLANIFELDFNNTRFVEVLEQLTGLEAKESDSLPKNVCESCITQAVGSYTFRQNCRNAHEILSGHVDSLKEKSTNNEIDSKTQIHQMETEVDEQIDDVCEDTELNGFIENLKSRVLNNVKNEENISTEDNASDLAIEVLLEDIVPLTDNIPKETIDKTIKELVEPIESDQVHSSDFEESVSGEDSAPIEHSQVENIDFEEVVSEEGDWVFDVEAPESVETTAELVYTCSCSLSFASSSEYFKHSEEVPHLISCYKCESKFESLAQLKTHMVTHLWGDNRFQCPHCSQTCSNMNNITRHMRIHTGERPYVCEMCGKGFIQETRLVVHRRMHTGERPYMCERCGKGFIESAVLRLHQKRCAGSESTKRGRSGINELSMCVECNITFQKRIELHRHNDAFHKSKRFLCQICGKTVASKIGLNTHYQEKHLHRRNFVHCSYCNKTCSSKTQLAVHIKTHTGEKPYECSICSTKFRQWGHLDTHMKVHTGEKPYVCSYCDKAFSSNGTLTVHKRTHTKETPYVCEVCDKGFYDSTSMKKHKKRWHSNWYSPPLI